MRIFFNIVMFSMTFFLLKTTANAMEGNEPAKKQIQVRLKSVIIADANPTYKLNAFALSITSESTKPEWFTHFDEVGQSKIFDSPEEVLLAMGGNMLVNEQFCSFTHYDPVTKDLYEKHRWSEFDHGKKYNIKVKLYPNMNVPLDAMCNVPCVAYYTVERDI